MGHRSLEWNCLVDTVVNSQVNSRVNSQVNNKPFSFACSCFALVPVFDSGRYGIYS